MVGCARANSFDSLLTTNLVLGAASRMRAVDGRGYLLLMELQQSANRVAVARLSRAQLGLRGASLRRCARDAVKHQAASCGPS